MSDGKTNVFISYAWGRGYGESFALWLYQFLTREYNVSVYFDKATTHPGSNLKKFMDEATTAKYIICICTDEYLQRMNVEGSGVKYEVDLIRNSNDATIIPLVDNQRSSLPAPFEDLKRVGLNMGDPNDQANIDAYHELLDYIFPMEPNHVSDDYIRQIREVRQKDKIKHSLAFNPSDSGVVSFDLDINDSKFRVGQGKKEFLIQWSTRLPNSVYIYNDYVDSSVFISQKSNCFEVTSAPGDLYKNGFESCRRCKGVVKGDCFGFINNNDFVLVGQMLNIDGNHIRFRYKTLDD